MLGETSRWRRSLRKQPPPFSSFSFFQSPVTQTEDWHSGEDNPGLRLKAVELMCELKRETWSRGQELLTGSDWLTQFLMESRHGWLNPSSFSFYLSISISCQLARVVSPHLLSALIVLHLFIQAFMAASSSCKPISPPDDGFLPQLSRLFIISANPHHISLTLVRWFSHWAALLTSHITNPSSSSHKHTHTQKVTRRGNLTSLYYTADLQGAKMLRRV